MTEQLTLAGIAAEKCAPVTGKRCPVCRNKRDEVGACERCEGRGVVALCHDCEGAGTVAAAGSPRGFVICGHCGGVGLEPPKPKLSAKQKRLDAAAKRKAGDGFSGRRQLPIPNPDPPREVRSKAGRDRERLESEGA